MAGRILLSGRSYALVVAGRSGGGAIEVIVTPTQVQFLAGVADNLLRKVLVGREHVQDGVPQWMGETVGFWNGDTLIAYSGPS